MTKMVKIIDDCYHLNTDNTYLFLLLCYEFWILLDSPELSVIDAKLLRDSATVAFLLDHLHDLLLGGLLLPRQLLPLMVQLVPAHHDLGLAERDHHHRIRSVGCLRIRMELEADQIHLLDEINTKDIWLKVGLNADLL